VNGTVQKLTEYALCTTELTFWQKKNLKSNSQNNFKEQNNGNQNF
jgi:hypothetical protein